MPKKLLKWAAIAFLVFFIAFRPQSAANLVSTVGNGLLTMANGVGVFFSNLAS